MLINQWYGFLVVEAGDVATKFLAHNGELFNPRRPLIAQPTTPHHV